MRTGDELRSAVDACPFPDADVAHLHVTFLDRPAAPLLAGLDVAAFAPEACAAVGRDIHLHLPGGIGRSALATALARRPSSAVATTRNRKTLLAVVALADEFD